VRGGAFRFLLSLRAARASTLFEIQVSGIIELCEEMLRMTTTTNSHVRLTIARR